MTLIYNGNSCDYLHSFGINPNRIPEHGWDATGYRAFPGDGPLGDGTRAPVHHPWPDGFNYQELLEAFAADGPSRHRGADVTTWKAKDLA